MMYFGTKEIQSIEDNIATLSDGTQIELEEKNKSLITSEAITGSDLQMKWAEIVAKEVVETLHNNNVRLTDIGLIFDLAQKEINEKNESALAKAFGKDKLDVLSAVFGSDAKLDSLAVRNIRIKDIF